MLRKLTNIFNQNQSSKLLDFVEVNSSNSKINFTYIEELRKVVQPASINQLIKELERGWTSSHPIEKLKYYIATHDLITNTLSQ